MQQKVTYGTDAVKALLPWRVKGLQLLQKHMDIYVEMKISL